MVINRGKRFDQSTPKAARCGAHAPDEPNLLNCSGLPGDAALNRNRRPPAAGFPCARGQQMAGRLEKYRARPGSGSPSHAHPSVQEAGYPQVQFLVSWRMWYPGGSIGNPALSSSERDKLLRSGQPCFFRAPKFDRVPQPTSTDGSLVFGAWRGDSSAPKCVVLVPTQHAYQQKPA
jgi:hypothetical protein